MYYGPYFSIAEMSPALPHTGGAYSFARSAIGPWGGFVTGLAEKDAEYVAALATAAATLGNAWATLAATIAPDESVGN
jgi:ethanolamine permease